MVTHRRIVKAEGPDFYPTTAWGTQILIDHEPFEGILCEPACGKGHMSKVLKTKYTVVSSDLYHRGYGTGGIDFLTTQRYQKGVANVVTNPPFNLAEQFLDKSLSVATHKVCLLLRLAFVESVGRYKRVFTTRPPTRIWVFPERLSLYPDGAPVKGGGTTAYGWFVWDKKNPSPDTLIKWFSLGYKNAKPRPSSPAFISQFRFSHAYRR